MSQKRCYSNNVTDGRTETTIDLAIETSSRRRWVFGLTETESDVGRTMLHSMALRTAAETFLGRNQFVSPVDATATSVTFTVIDS